MHTLSFLVELYTFYQFLPYTIRSMSDCFWTLYRWIVNLFFWYFIAFHAPNIYGCKSNSQKYRYIKINKYRNTICRGDCFTLRVAYLGEEIQYGYKQGQFLDENCFPRRWILYYIILYILTYIYLLVHSSSQTKWLCCFV